MVRLDVGGQADDACPQLRLVARDLCHCNGARGPLAGKPNPVGIRGAAQVDRASETRPASIPELTVIAAAMPARFRLAVLLSAFTGIRFGEMAELRRKDLSATLEQLRISRAVVRVKGRPIVKSTKSGRPRLVLCRRTWCR